VDVPDPGPSPSQYLRTPSAAESSRYPGVEARTGYSWREGHTSGVGVGGYWSPHAYGTAGSIDAWAGTLDWRLSLPARFALSGEAYKGQALGGLGAGAFKDIFNRYSYGTNSFPVLTKAAALRDAGGWAQLKFHPNSYFEFKGAIGLDEASAAQLREEYLELTNAYSGLARNQTFLGNIIYRPTASFLLSLEYRKLRSWQLVSPANEAQIFGLAAGFEF
jgi:hypothetical protein